jgi:hypothetical protein
MNHDLETLRDELERSLGGLDERQTQLHPGGDVARWNIQRIAGHLLLTYAATEAALEARIAKGTPTKADPTVAQRFGQFTILRAGYFPAGRKAPERVTAPADAPAVPGGVLIAQVHRSLDTLDRRIAEAEGVFGPELRAVSHMVLGPLSTRQWRRFHLIHGRHHIKQIAAIRAEYGL